ncbi:hypothetical protein CYY_002798 [Polysphondylium violaceum]|uniref:BRO1 domain-containing protein n=1 Tax=Polysphondylium violaceum TaxID=133409 RepID=A0A8J4PZL9_9MYCE|nr:hypothetical protein CYY_002798 [Polysphondylium violaceum]
MNPTETPWKLFMNKFEIPQSKRVQFEKVIRTQSPESATMLANTSLSRNELIIIIEKSSPSTIISACEKYLPDLYGLMISVEDNNSLRLNEQLCFSWSSINSKSSFYTGYSLRFELIMNLVVFGLAHYNRASEINDSTNEANFDENAKLIVNHLKIASGIFDFIARVELSRWMNPPEDRPLECTTNFSIALSSLCVSLANCVTVRKATKQKTSTAIIAKIACESWHKAELTKNFLKDLGAPHYKKLSKSLRGYLNCLITLLYSTTMMFMAKSYKEQEKVGDALAYFSLASPLSKYKKPSDSRLSANLVALVNEIQYEHQILTKENDVIYFEKRSDPNSLEQPQPKGLVSPLTFSPPMPSFMSIQ